MSSTAKIERGLRGPVIRGYYSEVYHISTPRYPRSHTLSWISLQSFPLKASPAHSHTCSVWMTASRPQRSGFG